MAQAVIGALRVNLGMNSAQFSKGIKNANSKLSRFGKNMKKSMAVVGVAAASAATAISVAVKGVLNDADAIAKSSRKIGVPVDELSRLKHAADLSGVSMGGLENGLKRLSANMYDASQGVGEGAKAFKAMGINVKNADGSLKSSTQVMAEMAEVFKTMPDGAEKTALAMRVMGKSGADMIPMLNGGADALKSMIDEADKMGIVITPEMAANAELFNDNLTRLSGSFKGLVIQLTSALAPTLAAISDKIVALVNGFKLLSPGTQKFIGIAAGLTAGITALAVPLGALVLTFGAISAPVLAAVAAIAAITAGIVAFWPEIKALGERLKTLPQDFINAFVNLHVEMAKIGMNIIQGLWSGIKAEWGNLKNGVTNIASGIKDSFTNFFKIKSPSRLMMGIGENITQGLAVGMTNGSGGALSVANDLSNSVSGMFEGIGSSMAQAIQGTKSWRDVALDAIQSVANQMLQSSFTSFGNTGGGGIFGSLLSGLFGGFRASGGPVSAGKAYMVGEQGPEIIVPGASGTVIPNHNLSAENNNSNVHVSVGVSVDDEGAIQAYVKDQTTSMGVRAKNAAVGEVKSSLPNWSSQIKQNGKL